MLVQGVQEQRSEQSSATHMRIPLPNPPIPAINSDALPAAATLTLDIWHHTKALLDSLWQQNWPSLRQTVQTQIQHAPQTTQPELTPHNLVQWLGQWQAWEASLQSGSLNPWLAECNLPEMEDLPEAFRQELTLLSAASQGKIEEAPSGQRMLLFPLWHGNALDLAKIMIEEEAPSTPPQEYQRQCRFHVEVMLHHVGHVVLAGTWQQAPAHKRLALELQVEPPLEEATEQELYHVFSELCAALDVQGTLA
jgi:hypothetical protein